MMIKQFILTVITSVLLVICTSEENKEKVLIDGGYTGFLDKEKYGIKCDEKYEGRCIHKFEFDYNINREHNIRERSIVFKNETIPVKLVELKYIAHHVRNNNLLVRFKYLDLIKPDTIKIQFNNSNIDCINYNVSGDVLSCSLTTKKTIKENVKLYLNYSYTDEVPPLEIGVELLNLEVDQVIPPNQYFQYSNIAHHVRNNNLLLHIENLDLIKMDTIKIQFNNSNIDCINYNVLGDVLSCTLTTKKSIKEYVKICLEYLYTKEVSRLEIGVELLNLEVDRYIKLNREYFIVKVKFETVTIIKYLFIAYAVIAIVTVIIYFCLCYSRVGNMLSRKLTKLYYICFYIVCIIFLIIIILIIRDNRNI